MGLIAKFRVDEQTGCKFWKFYSTIGTYDETTNPGGWGTPNPINSGEGIATIYILPHGYTKGWLLTVTMGAGMISDFTVTDPQGNVVNWFDKLDTLGGYTSFTYLEAFPLYITNEMFGLPAETNIFQGHVYIEENLTISVNGEDVTYTASEDQLMVCQLCCCIETSSANLDPTDCECKNDKIEKLTRAKIFMDSAIIMMEDADVNKSFDLYTKAVALCDDKCNC